ncbi:MAG: DUF1016 N-terminal domain-containing protein [Vulcanimicrobiota bacterium]
MSEQAKGMPASLEERPPGYAEWLADLKLKVQAAQQRASLAVNQELLRLYWQIGSEILTRQADAEWGSGILDQVSADLRAAFPEIKGFSRTNLNYMRAFAEAWPQLGEIGQQAVDQLPWGHNIILLSKLKTPEERLAHAHEASLQGWSRNTLALHIENRTLERQGRAITNFEQRLPKPQSDLAQESLKDPYRFDFLGIGVSLPGSCASNRSRNFLVQLCPGDILPAIKFSTTKKLYSLSSSLGFVFKRVWLKLVVPRRAGGRKASVRFHKRL